MTVEEFTQKTKEIHKSIDKSFDEIFDLQDGCLELDIRFRCMAECYRTIADCYDEIADIYQKESRNGKDKG